ncbi:putative ammonium transporter 3 isoform X2 [Argiope bruennichi]|nr:putative ammonium transporter 3 isoform X2 [Argiope bruennichi]
MDRIWQVLKRITEKHWVLVSLTVFLQFLSQKVLASTTNSTGSVIGSLDPVTPDDATWILTSSFVIFTMQTGFGLLESGAVTKKNEVNILMKNAADVVLGGLSYWMFGYGFQYGRGPGTTFFCGIGSFFLDSEPQTMGVVFATFIFQLSFATTATTIVSGAMAERTDFHAYCIFSFLNTLTYCIPAGWLWAEHGFLKRLGALDFAGSCAVHLTGGVSALVAAMMLKPRLRRYDSGPEPLPMGNPGNALVGTFTLWWGWLVFNCGSSFGISGDKWHYAGRSAVNTINASLGGGLAGLIYSYTRNKLFVVSDLINSILGALVAVTAGSGFLRSWESLVVGALGAILVNMVAPCLDRHRIDDPVGAVAVHAMGGLWGMIAVGLFIDNDSLLNLTHGRSGLFKGGGFYLLGVQILACFAVSVWSMTTTFLILKSINYFVPIRLAPPEEILGADFVEHDVRHEGYDYEVMMTELERLGLKLRHPRVHSPPRSQWDDHLILQYIEKVLVKCDSSTDPSAPSIVAQEHFFIRGGRRADGCLLS